jgi:predicted RNA-binding protein
MSVSSGPMVVTADYRVLKVSGVDVAVELTAPGVPTASQVITVGDDMVIIRDNFLFGGNWKRK